MQCKSLWIKASAKCINVNVNATKYLQRDPHIKHCASSPHAASFELYLTGILWKCKTCSLVLSSGRPVQRSLFLVSVPTMMASVMMVMVVVSLLNRFRQSVFIQIHLLRALWCKSGCGASHGGIRNGLRKKQGGGYIKSDECFWTLLSWNITRNAVLKLPIITLSCMLNLHFISDASIQGWTPDRSNDLRDYYDIKVSEAM